MDFQALPALSLPLLVQDALIAVGAGVALLGVLLPGLLTSLGRPEPDQRGAYLEFGPAGAPIISEPAPLRAAPLETDVEPRHVARPHLWSPSPEVRSHI